MKLRTVRWLLPVTLTGSTGVWIWANMHREYMTNFYLEQPYVKEPVEKILVKHKGAKLVLGSDIKKAEPSMEMTFYVSHVDIFKITFLILLYFCGVSKSTAKIKQPKKFVKLLFILLPHKFL